VFPEGNSDGHILGRAAKRSQRRHRHLEQGGRAAVRLFFREVIGKPITIVIPQDRLDEETGILQRIRRGERIDHFETVRQRKDSSLINISPTVSPVTDESGKIIGASKIARDITEQKRREEQVALLAREAEHRTKNLLALAQATVHLTQAETPGELKAAIEGRLQALAKAHTLLAQSRWAGADLHATVMDECRRTSATVMPAPKSQVQA
jgi:hypothetical protein